MKLYIFPTFSTQTVCANASFDAATKALLAQGAPAEAIDELNTIKEVAFAYECQSSKIGAFAISQDVKGGKLRFTISKTIEKTPLRIIDTDSVRAAKELLDTETGFKTIANEGGKRWMVSRAGTIVHAAQADSDAVPALYTLCNVYGGMIGAIA